MDNQVKLVLPYPPSVNHYKHIGRTITTKNGKTLQYRVNSNDTKVFYWEVAREIRLQTSVYFRDATISLEVGIDLHPPNKRLTDIDNRIKPILDGLQRGGLIVNDNQICRLVVRKCNIVANGKVIVTIKPMEADNDKPIESTEERPEPTGQNTDPA